MFALGALALVCVACSQTEDVNTQDQWDLDEEHNIEPDQGVDMSTFDIPEDCQSDGILRIESAQDVEVLANFKCPELFFLGINLSDETTSLNDIGDLKRIERLYFGNDASRYEPVKYRNVYLKDISGFAAIESIGSIDVYDLQVDDLTVFNELKSLKEIYIVTDPKDPSRIAFQCDEVVALVETLGSRYTGTTDGGVCTLPVQ